MTRLLDLPRVAGANAECATRASAAGLTGTYKAWISSSASDDPESTFTQATCPYKLVDGAQVAADWTDLTDGTILNDPVYVADTGAASMEAPYGLAIYGDYAFVTSAVNGVLRVVDISDPLNPNYAYWDNDAAYTGSKYINLSADGQYAYIANYDTDSLLVVDISTPTSPNVVGSVSDAALDGAYDVTVNGNFVYVSSKLGNAITVVDVTTKSAPVVRGTISDGTLLYEAEGIKNAGNLIYVAARNRFTIVDASDPDTLSLRDSYGIYFASSSSKIRDVAINGNKAFTVDDMRYWFYALDITDPDNIISDAIGDSTVTNTGEDAWALAMAYDGKNIVSVDGDCTGEFTMYDVRNTVSPMLTGDINDADCNGELSTAYDVVVVGDYAYITAWGADRLTVVDISNPGAPINADENGNYYNGEVWTGTLSSGAYNSGPNQCSGWTTSSGGPNKATTGEIKKSFQYNPLLWSDNGDKGCNQTRALYCFEQ